MVNLQKGFNSLSGMEIPNFITEAIVETGGMIEPLKRKPARQKRLQSHL